MEEKLTHTTEINASSIGTSENPSNKIFTVPNCISFVRFCLIPLFLVLFFHGYNLAATLVFALAACTDWIDGQIARRTNSVSKLGQLFDPMVDRLLMIAGVIALVCDARLPLWIVILVLIRDLLLLIGGALLLKFDHIRIPVIYLGKVATTFLFVGVADLFLNAPRSFGLGLCDIAWLPGFSGFEYVWGIWFVYIGLVLGIVTTSIYVAKAICELKKHRKSHAN